MKRDEETEAFLNVIFRQRDDLPLYNRLYDEVMEMHKTITPPVKGMKERLGRQAYTVQLSNRNWVWETDTWRLYASWTGLSFEVPLYMTDEDKLAAWQDFRVKAGLTSKEQPLRPL